MSHSLNPPVQITTGRPPELIPLPGGISLQRRTTAHAPALNAAVTANLDHLRPWMPWAAQAPALAETLELSRVGESAWDAGGDFMYLVTPDGEPETVIGAFGLHGRIGPGALEIGYWVDHGHTRRGIATAAAEAVTATALALPGIQRVEIHCDESNGPSAAVPRRLGYRLDRIIDSPVTAPSETGRKMIWLKHRAVA